MAHESQVLRQLMDAGKVFLGSLDPCQKGSHGFKQASARVSFFPNLDRVFLVWLSVTWFLASSRGARAARLVQGSAEEQRYFRTEMPSGHPSLHIEREDGKWAARKHFSVAPHRIETRFQMF